MNKCLTLKIINTIMDTVNKNKQQFLATKTERRIKKRSEKRAITGEEVIFIFEKVLEKWPTIRIYNTIIQRKK